MVMALVALMARSWYTAHMKVPKPGGPTVYADFRWTPLDRHVVKRLKLPSGSVQPLRREDVDDLRLVRHEAAWLETNLNSEWRAAYRLVVQGGEPVIAELRIFPREAGPREPGTWRGEWLGVRAPVPRGGLMARTLRRLRPGIVPAQLGEILDALSARFGPSLFEADGLMGRLELPANRPPASARRGRTPLPDAFYASLAHSYVRALRAGTRQPVEAVAKKRKLSLARVRDLLHKARVRGFLTFPSKQGRAGGMLTPKAQAVLKAAQKKGGRHGTTRQRGL